MKTRKQKIYKKKRTLRLCTLQTCKDVKGGQDKDERQIDFVVNNSVFNASQDKKEKKEEKEDAFSNKDNYKGRTVLNVYKRDNKTLAESFYKADELIASILLGFHDVNPTYLPQYKKQIEFNIKNGRNKKNEHNIEVDSVNKYTYDLVFHESPFNMKTGGGENDDYNDKLSAIIEKQYEEFNKDPEYTKLSALAKTQYRKKFLKKFKPKHLLLLEKKQQELYSKLETFQPKKLKDEKTKEYNDAERFLTFFKDNVDKIINEKEDAMKVNAFDGALPTDRVVVEIHAKNDMDALEIIRESVTQVDESLAGLSKEARGYKLHILPKYKKSVKIANKHGLNIFDKTREKSRK